MQFKISIMTFLLMNRYKIITAYLVIKLILDRKIVQCLKTKKDHAELNFETLCH